MIPLQLGVESDDHDDLEIGCRVWSTTHQDPQGQVGGVVIALLEVPEPAVKVLRYCGPTTGPVVAEIPYTAIDMGTVTFDTHSAEKAAQSIDLWLTRLKDKRARERANAREWRAIAMILYDLRDGGMYCPKAERRYQATQQAKRLERGW